jgi:hypothetical protein
MEKTEEYRGFAIVARSGQTEVGKCHGSYKVTAATKEAEEMMDRKPIAGWGTERLHTTSDDRASNPNMLNHEHLFEMARGEIDRFIDGDSK